MVMMFVRHTVADFETWKTAFDEFESMRRASGMIADAVYQATDDATDVTVVNEFATLQQAQAFAESPELGEGMGLAGVMGAPTVWFTEKVSSKKF